jgi:hypothetical protein
MYNMTAEEEEKALQMKEQYAEKKASLNDEGLSEE